MVELPRWVDPTVSPHDGLVAAHVESKSLQERRECRVEVEAVSGTTETGDALRAVQGLDGTNTIKVNVQCVVCDAFDVRAMQGEQGGDPGSARIRQAQPPQIPRD